MSIRPLTVAALAGLLAVPALAAPPKALDYIPSDAPVALVIRNVDALVDKAEAMVKLVSPAAVDQIPFEDIRQNMSMVPGFDPKGSIGLALYTDGEEEPNPENMVLIAPITSFDDIAAMSEDLGDGIYLLDMDGQELFIKQLGKNFAVASGDQDLLADYTEGGHLADNKSRFGEIGMDAADRSAVFLVADIEIMRAGLEEAIDAMEEQAAMVGAMTGQDVSAQTGMMKSVLTSFMNDGEVAIASVYYDNDGVALELASQFKEDSESAAYFQSGGNSSKLIGHLPATDFIFAIGMDSTTEGVQKLLQNAKPAIDGLTEGVGFNVGLPSDWAKLSGYSFVMGNAPGALQTGFMSNTVIYTQMKDAEEYAATKRKTITEMNGASAGPVSFTTEYQDGVKEIDGVKVDSYTVRMGLDNAGGGMGMMDPTMMIQMLFGPSGGPRGYIAHTDDAIIETVSRNDALLRNAISAAKDGDGLGSMDTLKLTADKLPEGRFMEGYVSVSSIVNTAAPFLVMMQVIDQFDPVDAMAPIGFAATAEEGGALFRLYVPNTAVELVSSLIPEDAFGSSYDNDDWENEDPEF